MMAERLMRAEKAGFRLAEGNLMISKEGTMTQAEGLKAAQSLKGYHMSSDVETDVLERVNTEVKKLANDFYIVTSTTGQNRYMAFERLDGGKRRYLSDKNWDELSDTEKEAIRKELYRLPVEKRGFEYSGGIGPTFVGFVYGRVGGLSVDAYTGAGRRGYVVLVPDGWQAGAVAQITKVLRVEKDEVPEYTRLSDGSMEIRAKKVVG